LIEAIRAIEEHLGGRVVLVVIDTLSKTFGAGKENTDDMVTYVANCQRISSEFECLAMPVHHRPKDQESEDPRGHSSLKGGSETVILIESGETKKARVTKQKDGEDGIELLFRLKVIELGLDEDNEPVTSCVVEATDVDLVPRGEAIGAKLAHLPDGAKLVLRHLDETAEQAGIYPPTSIPDAEINRMKVGKVVLLDDWRAKSVAAAGHDPDIKSDTLTKAFRRNLVRLQNDGIVRVWNQYAWRTWEARTQSDIKSDTDKSRSGHPGHSGFPPTGEYPRMSGAMSDVPGAECPGWMDEAPPWEPDDMTGNPILDGRR
jgi:hypothetical protein